MRLAICNEMFEGRDLRRICRDVKALGYDGIELAPFTLASRITDLSASDLRAVRSTVEGEGLAVVGLHWLLAKTEGFHLTHPDREVRQRTADYLRALGEACAELGGSVMVLGSPKQRNLLPGVALDDGYGYAAEVLGRALPTIGAAGVDLCLEPLGPAETDFLNTIGQANTLIDSLNHPSLLLQLDVKAQTTDPEGSVPGLFRHYGAVAGHVHIQEPDGRGPGFGPTDWPMVLGGLSESSYERWISVEVFDSSPGIDEVARQAIARLDPTRNGDRAT